MERELALGILITVGLLIACIPIRLFADWVMEKWVCKNCDCKNCDCKNCED